MALMRKSLGAAFLLTYLLPIAASAQVGDAVTEVGDSVSIRFVDADVRGAIQIMGRYLDRPVTFGTLPTARVTLETPQPVARGEIVGLLRAMLESQNLELAEVEGAYLVRSLGGAGMSPSGLVAAGVDGQVDLHLIRLRHARAADVAATVNALYGRATALGELGARPPTLGENIQRDRIPPVNQAAVPPGAATLSQEATLLGEVTIVPDTRTNSLLVRSSASDFQLISLAVQQLDVRPLQVLIEVIIAEVRRDRGFNLGVSTNLPTQAVAGTTNTTLGGSTTGLGVGDLVLHILNIGGVDLDATLTAAASRGDVSILSRPVLLATNNEEAQILVGSQRPFIQVQRALPTDAPIRDQVIQYRDVGTQLVVRPTISTDGYVMLEVTQEVNAATSEMAFDAPVISTRAIQTQLLVRDGQTAVLGGLSDRQRDFTRAGVPFLSELPLVGWIFGRASRRTTETELFVFLTPRVIADDDAMVGATEDVRENSRRVRPNVDRAIDQSPVRTELPPTREEETPP